MILQTVQEIHSIDVHDIMFRPTDVIGLILFVASACGIYFYTKYRLEKMETRLAEHIISTERDMRSVHTRINDTRSNHDELEKEMIEKHEELLNTIHAMEIKSIEKISEIKNKN